MKQLIFSFVFVLLACQCFAQTPLTRKEELWQKSKHQKSIGFVLLGEGAAVSLVSISINGLDNFFGGNSSKGNGGLIAGVTLMAGSVSFFIMANHNRKLSLSLTSFKNFLQDLSIKTGT
jgi:hypothetical protein